MQMMFNFNLVERIRTINVGEPIERLMYRITGQDARDEYNTDKCLFSSQQGSILFNCFSGSELV